MDTAEAMTDRQRGRREGLLLGSGSFVLWFVVYLTLIGLLREHEGVQTRTFLQEALETAQGLNSSADQLTAALQTVQTLYESLGTMQRQVDALCRLQGC